MSITRRDFLNGVALGLAGASIGLFSCTDKKEQAAIPPKNKPYYPPSRTRLRGNHDGSFEVAHELSWRKKQYSLETAKPMGDYDLVVVGAGISGLSAAYRYHKTKPDAKILILDNHDDFGGHAKRNEMHFEGGMRLSYGGSESFDSPKANFGQDINALMQDLAIDYRKFEQFFDQEFNARHQLSAGIFFDKKYFGKHKVVAHTLEKSEHLKAALDEMPLSDSDKQALYEMIDAPKDYLGAMPQAQRAEFLMGISYDTFLKDYVKASEGVLTLLADICLEYWGFGIDHLSAYDALGEGYPAMSGLGVAVESYHSEPYIYHFPDGNASVARLLVRAMIPKVSTSTDYDKMSAMEAVVLDKFDYEALDRQENQVHLRLNATCVRSENHQDKVALGYIKDGTLYQVTAKHAIMAGNHRLMPYLVPEMTEEIKTAFSQNVKVPLIYTKVLIKDWHAFKKLKVYNLYAPKSPYALVMLDYPVSMGGYQFPQTPDEPMIVHMVRIPVPYDTGKSLREACQMGRREVYTKPFAALEQEALDQLSTIFELAGERLKDKVLAVTINRWSHGYSYEENILYDDEKTAAATQTKTQSPIGNIHFANSDAAWQPYMHGAIEQGLRAVNEVLAKLA